MLLSYGEFEFSIATCLGMVLEEDMAGFRTLYRLRSETQKIQVADAILRPVCKRLNISAIYSDALGAVRLCKDIRNQFAHCHWWPQINPRYVGFTSFDTPAQSQEGNTNLTVHWIDLALLQKQAEYFGYTFDQWFYLEDQIAIGLGKPGKNGGPISKPQKLPRVPKHIDPPPPEFRDQGIDVVPQQ